MVAQEVPTSAVMALPHGPAGVAEARSRLRTDLSARAVPEPVIDDAVLILSELLSNSCRHARPLGDHDYGYDSAYDDEDSGRHSDDGLDPAGARAPAGRVDGGTGGIRATWVIDADGLLVLEVTDGGGPTRPRPSSPSLSAHGGRGLGIVNTLSLRWGVRDDAPCEVTVWVHLPVRGRHARRDDMSRGNGSGGGNGNGSALPMGVPLDLPLDLAESLDELG
jgi:hypothetical protein